MRVLLAGALSRLVREHRVAEAICENRRDTVRSALRLGATWTDIGNATGMSRQAAHGRFGRQLS
jgi:hypothetical protein